jgi:hypothetical protein
MKGLRRGISGGIFLVIFGSVMFTIYREFRFFSGFGFIGVMPMIMFAIVTITIITSIIQGIKSDQGHNPHKDDHHRPDYYNHRQDNSHTYNQPKQYNVYRGYYNRCPMCDSETEPDQKFCINCGNKLKD